MDKQMIADWQNWIVLVRKVPHGASIENSARKAANKAGYDFFHKWNRMPGQFKGKEYDILRKSLD